MIKKLLILGLLLLNHNLFGQAAGDIRNAYWNGSIYQTGTWTGSGTKVLIKTDGAPTASDIANFSTYAGSGTFTGSNNYSTMPTVSGTVPIGLTEYFFGSIFLQQNGGLLLTGAPAGTGFDIKSTSNLFNSSENPPGHFRDPSIMFYNGLWRVAYTPGSFGATAYFSQISSPDLKVWTSGSNVSTTGIAGANTSWAPEWFVDGTSLPYMLGAVKGTSGTFNLVYMQASNTNLTAFTSAVAITGTGFPTNPIDPFILKVSGTYYLYFGEDLGGLVRVASSTSAFSGYNVTGTIASGEGPCVVQLSNGTFRMFWDDGGAWSHIDSPTPTFTSTSTKISEFGYGGSVRHATILRLTDPALIAQASGFDVTIPQFVDFQRIVGQSPWTTGAEAVSYFGPIVETQRAGYVNGGGWMTTPYPAAKKFWIRETTYDAWMPGHVCLEAGKYLFWGGTNTSVNFDSSGTTAPEGVVAGNVGSVWRNNVAGTLSIKTSGTSNTGWTQLAFAGTATYLASDLVVTNDSTFTGTSSFQVTVPPGTYRMTGKAFVQASSVSSAGSKLQLAVVSGSATPNVQVMYSNVTGTSLNDAQWYSALPAKTTFPIYTSGAFGGGGNGNLSVMGSIDGQLVVSSTAVIRFECAEFTASPGNTATMLKGSFLSIQP